MKKAKFKISDQEIIDIYLSTNSLIKTAMAAQGITGTATIAKKLKSLGIEVKNHKLKPIQVSDEELIRLYKSGMSLMEIATKVSGSKGAMQVKKRLNELGIDTSYAKNIHKYKEKMSIKFHKYELDEHVFDCIDTEDKAYWLGFLMADGYNHEGKHAVCLRLQSGDIELLEKFQNFLKSTAPIYTFQRITKVNRLIKSYSELRVNSVHLSSQLAKLGCTAGKTYTLEYPKCIPEHLSKHFIRGFFDGDGCISITNRKNRKSESSKVYQFTLTGRESVLLKIQEILMNETGVSKIPLKKRKDSFIQVLHYNGFNNVFKLTEYLYKDSSIYLKRKYDKYLQLVTRQSNLQ